MLLSDCGSDVCSSDLLRAVPPSLAAASGMRFWLFACTDANAAFAWFCAFIMPGVAFGASLGLAAEVAGRLATLLLLLIVGTWSVLWLAIAFARWVSRKTTQWLPDRKSTRLNYSH